MNNTPDSLAAQADTLLDGFDSLIATAQANDDRYAEGYVGAMKKAFTKFCADALERQAVPKRECTPLTCEYIDGTGRTDCDYCNPNYHRDKKAMLASSPPAPAQPASEGEPRS